jgi:alkylation response protein AidB-like acyl-CoA dehydrogenase
MRRRDTPEEAAFRAEARAWLEAHARPRGGEAAGPRDHGPEAEAAFFERCRAWQRTLFDGGFAGITWPRRHGGRGGTPAQAVIFAEELEAWDETSGFLASTIDLVGPALLHHGSDAQRERSLRPLLRGDEVWCQLFSEPGAGSDLAGLRTRAVRDGDHWIVNGQKIWTSGAHWADHAILVTRSDPRAPKHKGLTFFFLTMKTPGIETRRIKQISGQSHFNEVYLTDVRIPDSQRLGAAGQGWGVAITTLMNERLTSGELRGPDVEELFALARAVELEDGPAIANAAVRERLADYYVRTQGVRWSRFRTMTALSRGDTPGPENSIGKLVNAPKAQDMASFALDLMDMGGVVSDKEFAPMRAAFQEALLSSPGSRIAAGTDEILKNIIAERVRGRAPDVRVDREVPFDELPASRR